MGGSIASNWENGNSIFSKVNLPVGPEPVTLSFGKGQALFQPQSNLSTFISAGANIWGALNNLYPNAWYNINWYSFSSGFGGDNVIKHLWTLLSTDYQTISSLLNWQPRVY